VNQGWVEPSKDVIPGVYEDGAYPLKIHARIITSKHIEDEVVGARGSLDPLGKRPTRPFGLFEAVYYGVANPQGVPQPLEVYGVLAGTRGAKESRTAARSQDEVVVGERFCVRANLLSAEVHSHNLSLE
jgi:hypothetical protein